MLKLSGLWKQKDSNGNVYYSGNISPKVRVLVFPNRARVEGRGSDNQPHFEIFLDGPRDTEQNNNAQEKEPGEM